MLRRCAEILTAQGQLVYGPVLRKFQVLRRSTRNWRPDILRHSLGLRKSENETLKFCDRGIKVFSSLQQPSAVRCSVLPRWYLHLRCKTARKDRQKGCLILCNSKVQLQHAPKLQS